MRRCSGRMTKPPAYPFRYLAMSNSRGTKQTAVANTTWRQQPARPEFHSAPFPRPEPYLAIPRCPVKTQIPTFFRSSLKSPTRFRLPASPSLPASPPFGEAVSRGHKQREQDGKIIQAATSLQAVVEQRFLASLPGHEGDRDRTHPKPRSESYTESQRPSDRRRSNPKDTQGTSRASEPADSKLPIPFSSIRPTCPIWQLTRRDLLG